MRELKRNRVNESFRSGVFPEDDSYSDSDFDADFRWLHRAFISNIGTLEDRLHIETKEDIEYLIEYMERMLKKIDSFTIAGKEHLRQDLYSQIEELEELYKEYSIGESRKCVFSRKVENVNISDLDRIVSNLPDYPDIKVKVLKSDNVGTMSESLEVLVISKKYKEHLSFDERDTENSIESAILSSIERLRNR